MIELTAQQLISAMFEKAELNILLGDREFIRAVNEYNGSADAVERLRDTGRKVLDAARGGRPVSTTKPPGTESPSPGG